MYFSICIAFDNTLKVSWSDNFCILKVIFIMLDLGDNYFGITDYILLGATLLVSLLIGLYYGYVNKSTNEELLVGGRNMSIFPVAASVMVTYLSAITIIGFPSEVYAHGSQIFLMHLVAAVGISTSPFIFVPFFYPMKLTSINEYLEKRFDSKWIRWLASGIFILQQLILSGVVLYAPSIALEAFVGFPMWISVLGMGICATIYTNIGGIKVIILNLIAKESQIVLFILLTFYIN